MFRDKWQSLVAEALPISSGQTDKDIMPFVNCLYSESCFSFKDMPESPKEKETASEKALEHHTGNHGSYNHAPPLGKIQRMRKRLIAGPFSLPVCTVSVKGIVDSSSQLDSLPTHELLKELSSNYSSSATNLTFLVPTLYGSTQ